MKKRMLASLGGMLIFFIGLALISPVSAQAELEKASVGLGAGIGPDYEGSDDYSFVPYSFVPMLFGEAIWESGRYVKLSGTKLRANLLSNEVLRFGPLLNYRFGRNDAVSIDDDIVKRMHPVDDSLEAGGFAGIQLLNWNLMIEAMNDVSSGHEGFVFTLSTGYDLPVTDALTLSLGASANWVDQDYMRSFFGVDAADSAASGLPVYTPKTSSQALKDVGFNLGAQYKLSDKWSLRLTSGYSRLIDDAKDSPVVDLRGDDNQYYGGLMAVYTLYSKPEKEVAPPAPPAPPAVPVPPAPPKDSDGDGVPDNLDKCPNTPKGVKVDSNGCPLDSDGDGVPDYLDECPDTPKGATVNKKGCWALSGLVLFDFDKYVIKAGAYPLLDEVVTILKKNPALVVVIEGHTDSKGSEAYNQRLSEKRADTVKGYIEGKGIASSRLTSKGYGESQPIASNDTEEGRQENRRVQLEKKKM